MIEHSFIFGCDCSRALVFAHLLLIMQHWPTTISRVFVSCSKTQESSNFAFPGIAWWHVFRSFLREELVAFVDVGSLEANCKENLVENFWPTSSFQQSFSNSSYRGSYSECSSLSRMKTAEQTYLWRGRTFLISPLRWLETPHNQLNRSGYHISSINTK